MKKKKGPFCPVVIGAPALLPCSSKPVGDRTERIKPDKAQRERMEARAAGLLNAPRKRKVFRSSSDDEELGHCLQEYGPPMSERTWHNEHWLKLWRRVNGA